MLPTEEVYPLAGVFCSREQLINLQLLDERWLMSSGTL